MLLCLSSTPFQETPSLWFPVDSERFVSNSAKLKQTFWNEQFEAKFNFLNLHGCKGLSAQAWVGTLNSAYKWKHTCIHRLRLFSICAAGMSTIITTEHSGELRHMNYTQSVAATKNCFHYQPPSQYPEAQAVGLKLHVLTKQQSEIQQIRPLAPFIHQKQNLVHMLCASNCCRRYHI